MPQMMKPRDYSEALWAHFTALDCWTSRAYSVQEGTANEAFCPDAPWIEKARRLGVAGLSRARRVALHYARLYDD